MASRIITKKGSGAPLASDLVHGELAVDTVNKRLYTENAGGTVIEVGTSPSTIDINAGTIDGTVIGGSTPAPATFTTVTADGLTVANTAVIAGDFDGGTAATYVRFQDDTDNFLIGSNASLGNFLIKNETADALRLGIANNGDISFYEDTGTTAKFFWDASSESLGIGTSSPESPIDINRTSTDGNIATLRKDGTTVGSIGCNAGAHLTIGNADTGLLFNATTDKIHPWNMSTQGVRDGAIDLGVDVSRFKDLYLSGGIHANNAFQRWKVVDNSGGSGIFSTITTGEPQTGFLYAYEIGTSKYIIAALFKQDESSAVTPTQIANNGLTVNATNDGGTIALAGATTTSNVRMQAVTIKRS